MYQNRLDTTLSILVLIDTWWNVNFTNNTNEQTVRVGFNRYMVECEWWWVFFLKEVRIWF